jgi:hypothetical protein
MSEPIAKAQFGLADPKEPQKMKAGSSFAVHFNPSTLQFTATNTLKGGSGKRKQQYVSQTSGQLALELIFDTTDTGADVRVHTGKLLTYMQPEPATKAPPIVHFEWGTFMFRGMIDSYRETVDFFAANGVPLRATVNITLASQERLFDTSLAEAGRNTDVQLFAGSTLGAAQTAARAGNPDAGRAIAAGNNQESLRFGSGPLTVSAGVQLNAAAAFAGGAGVSTGVASGAGGGAGASFGVTAADGAFDGLRAQLTRPGTARLDTDALLPPVPLPGIATDSGALFSLGGKATLEGSAALSADVGANASLRGRIQFDP